MRPQGTPGGSAPLLDAMHGLAPRPAQPRRRINYGRLGTVTLYEPAGTPKELVLFISGDGGWISGVIEMARHFAEQGALVAGIDVNQYGKALRESATAASSPPASSSSSRIISSAATGSRPT